ncbi:MAG TPA: cytochrome C oxidase subunit IV family protein [Nocardioidaceae bacterium]|nr:cytochrome C oxidase subunit IV family protein [Nocardioidaceae bacterium]
MSRIDLLFGALVGATVLTWLVGVESSASHTVAGVAVLAIGFIKLRLVGIHFMELGNAPVVLRSIFEAYAAVAFLVLTILYIGV